MTQDEIQHVAEQLGIDSVTATGTNGSTTTSPDEISSASSDAAGPPVRVTTDGITATLQLSAKENGKGDRDVDDNDVDDDARVIDPGGELFVGEELRRSLARPARPLSMGFLRGLLYCQECVGGNKNHHSLSTVEYDQQHPPALSELYNLQALRRQNSSVSPLVSAPMLYNYRSSSAKHVPLIESLIGEYVAACRVYGCGDRINAGVLTTIRFSLPSLRVGGDFHDADVLALTEVLLRHANGALSYIQRLDFTIGSQEGRGRHNSSKLGFTSHGAFCLSKVLQHTRHVKEVLLPRHHVGPYGASAIFMACSTNPTITTLGMRRCRIGERGALAFAELICPSSTTGLVDVDLSANVIGFRGTSAIDRALLKREQAENATVDLLQVNLEGNHVFPEVRKNVFECCSMFFPNGGDCGMAVLEKSQLESLT
jgi:hypothetical protein